MCEGVEEVKECVMKMVVVDGKRERESVCVEEKEGKEETRVRRAKETLFTWKAANTLKR